MQKILLVEDELETQFLVKALLHQKYELIIAGTAREARDLARNLELDLVLLDVGLPDGNGFEVFTELRALSNLEGVPIVFLTGKSGVTDRVAGFALGADDYVVKPFEPLEFRARVEAKMMARRSRKTASDRIRKGRLELDREMFRAFTVDEHGKSTDLNLTPYEFRLLIHFVTHEGHLLSRTDLMSAVWGDQVHVLKRTIDRHISTLRRKLDSPQETLEAVHGLGYRFSIIPHAKLRAA